MRAKLKPIHNQVVVLFGATSGIGLETALHMVEKGAKVVIVGRSQEGLNDAVERVQSHAQASMLVRNRGNGKRHDVMSTGIGGSTNYAAQATDMGTRSSVVEVEEQVLGLEADITDFEQVRSVAEQVIQRFGRIDTWVNVAAVAEWALFEDTSPDEFRRIIEVNLIGQAYGAMAVLPYMKQQTGGSIIFVSSIAGRVPIPYQSAYNASKHGILGMVDTLRQEVRHTHIPVSVTSILPASINTPLFTKARTKIGVEPHPIPPIYDAKMVAKAITYAAQHPVRELIVGDSGYTMSFMRRLAPSLTSDALGASGFRLQRSNEPKSPQQPDNLYDHMTGYNQVDGEYSPQTRRFSPMTWLATHPKARMAIYAAVLGGLALFISSRQRSKTKRTWRYQVYHQAQDLGHKAGTLLATLPLLSSLPMFQRKNILQRAGSRLSDGISSVSDRVPFSRNRSLPKRVVDQLPFNRPKPFIERTPLYQQRKAIHDTIYEKLPTGKDLRKTVDKVADKISFVERRETLIAKMPFGERRETIVEKVPFKK